jgi:predicted nucleic acid-binding protein
MKPRRIYIDTSVVGGCLDSEFRAPSVQLFDRFRNGSLIAVVSDLLRSEIAPAPEEVQAVLDAVPSAHLEEVLMTGEARDLAERYIGAGVITRKLLTDAMHIATATVHRADVLASWNFKHIVNVRRIHGYNSVNLLEGRPFLAITTPAEVIAHGK